MTKLYSVAKEKGWSLNQLSIAAGFSSNHGSLINTGKIAPTPEAIKAYSEILEEHPIEVFPDQVKDAMRVAAEYYPEIKNIVNLNI